MQREVPVQVFVNGEKRDVENNMSLAVFLTQLGLAGQPLAVELNGCVIKKQNHATTPLREGDRLEVVTFVGGG